MPEDSGVTRLFRTTHDGRRLGLLDPDGWLTVDHGHEVGGAQGALTYRYGKYMLALTDFAVGSGISGPPSALDPEKEPPPEPGELSVASFNVENLFDPVDDPGKSEGDATPSETQYRVEIDRRARAIAEHLGPPDILGLQEVENLRVLEDLVAHPSLAGVGYQPVLIEGADARGIDVGLLFDRDRLALVSAHAAQLCSELPPSEGFDAACTTPGGTPGRLLYGRPPLVVELEVRATGGRLAVVVNHFKSKSGDEAANLPLRVAMAEHNRELAEALAARLPGSPVIVLGDLNDFEDSEPIARLTAGGLRDLHALVPDAEDYTYIFDGVSQILDYILVNEATGVLAFGPVHMNVDFAARPAAGAGEPLPERYYRMSDHDPLLARIALPEAQPGTLAFRAYLPLALDSAGAGAGGGAPSPVPPASGTPAPTSAPTQPATSSPTAVEPTASAPSPTFPPTQPPTPAPSETPGGPPPRTPLRIEEIHYDGDVPTTEGDEHVEIRNVTGADVDLTGWRLVSVQGDQVFHFPAGARIEAGEDCHIYTNEDHPERDCSFNWHSDQAIWRNSGDKAELRDPGGALVDWYCYGNYVGSCG
jgi:endonuclease/exonuclease/phosphatase family metal-dependent hydrolase